MSTCCYTVYQSLPVRQRQSKCDMICAFVQALILHLNMLQSDSMTGNNINFLTCSTEIPLFAQVICVRTSSAIERLTSALLSDSSRQLCNTRPKLRKHSSLQQHSTRLHMSCTMTHAITSCMLTLHFCHCSWCRSCHCALLMMCRRLHSSQSWTPYLMPV